MSEGLLFFIFTRDFQNVDRRRSEKKRANEQKNNVRCKTCTFLSCPIQEKKNVK